MKHTLYILAILVTLVFGAVSCIEDGFSTSPSDQPTFSVDTVHIGTVFTDEPTPTTRFVVHNRHGKALSISDIHVSGADADCFRINVDGISGSRFSGVEIRPSDSIFVFVEATLPERTGLVNDYEATIDFTTNGITQQLPVVARGQNVTRLRGLVIDRDTRFTADKPYQIYDSISVSPGVTLTLEPGVRLCFHDQAMLIVRGTLRSLGTAEEPVVMGGDRTGNVVSDISFEIMSRQWVGVFFTYTSQANLLSHTTIHNTRQGVTIEGSPDVDYTAVPQLTIHNSRLRNSGGLALEAYHSGIVAVGSEFAEASEGLVYLQGGSATFNHCTLANYYLFTAISGPALQLAHISDDPKTGLDDTSGLPYLQADFTNCILYGLGGDISHGDLAGTAITLRRCLLKSEGTDDDNFQYCIWGEDPLYYTEREKYVFDYRLRPDSPALGASYSDYDHPLAATDAYGLSRGSQPDLGAYVYVQPED